MLCMAEQGVIVLATQQPVLGEEELVTNTEPGWSTVGWLDISVIIRLPARTLLAGKAVHVVDIVPGLHHQLVCGRLSQYSNNLRNYLFTPFIPLYGQFWTQNDQDL